MSKKAHGEIISHGVDWITVICTDSERSDRLLQLGRDLVTFRLRQGLQRKGWGMAGFSGFQSLGVQYGVRQGESIVRLSGDLADLEWRQAYALATNCSRLDIQCTTRTDEHPARRIARAFTQARRHGRGQKKPPGITYIRNTSSGNTLYLGCRSSDVYGRIYDKGAESKVDYFAGSVRDEIEIKGDRASVLIRRLAATRNEFASVIGCLSSFFRGRGVLPVYEPSEHVPIVTHRFASDNDGVLRWLRNQCGPSIRRVICAGLSEELMLALGVEVRNGKLVVAATLN